ncbi:hypothetical protein KGM_201903 [Danaus plexippus plexippus]|uniref:Uncharacterized protein n=1 Tax=Danaus plexippus plexippus TaxID=278856 RepID=A0A212F7Z3_DANPL|nr:hypothetical protein KGM_201903 [Danaus plexippus plexippus]
MYVQLDVETRLPNICREQDKTSDSSDLSITERPPSPPLELSDTSIVADEPAYPRTSRACCSDRGQRQVLKSVSILDGAVSVQRAQLHDALCAKQVEFVVKCVISMRRVFRTINFEDLRVASNSVSVSDSEARARSLEESLEAAMRVLKNKEETVRVQAESLALAEERLATLGQEKKEMVQTLQDNLSVIEDLYRECFNETARQDEIIALLRNTCRGQGRVMETRKKREKDIALEVENLKVEISNFLNNSTNNDSVQTNIACGVILMTLVDGASRLCSHDLRLGVWETVGGEGRGGEVADELRGVLDQLQRLWDVLQVRTGEWEWDYGNIWLRVNEWIE